MTQQTADRYPLGRSQSETDRLMWSARQLRTSIEQFLKDAGVEPGMKVLDVGCGAGDVSLIAGEIVGQQGSVVGIDLNEKIVETARSRLVESGVSNVSYVHGRIPEDLNRLDRDFDAIVGRRVLCYIPNATAALAALLEHAKPGTVVGFQEIDWKVWGQQSFPVSSYFEAVWGWVQRAFEAGGTDMRMGTNLYKTFLDAGLPEPLMKAEAGIGGSASLPFAMNILRSTRETIIREGIAPADEVEPEVVEQRLRAEFVKLRTVVTGGFEVKAWARKP